MRDIHLKHIKKHIYSVIEYTKDDKTYYSQYDLWFSQENKLFFGHVITVVLVRTSHLRKTYNQ